MEASPASAIAPDACCRPTKPWSRCCSPPRRCERRFSARQVLKHLETRKLSARVAVELDAIRRLTRAAKRRAERQRARTERRKTAASRDGGGGGGELRAAAEVETEGKAVARLRHEDDGRTSPPSSSEIEMKARSRRRALPVMFVTHPPSGRRRRRGGHSSLCVDRTDVDAVCWRLPHPETNRSRLMPRPRPTSVRRTPRRPTFSTRRTSYHRVAWRATARSLQCGTTSRTLPTTRQPSRTPAHARAT